ncbi:extracellular solute-binding protein [Cellulomonas sp. URHE0023]|uniref:extracellular solute-binding protein n=1 Tax=Cellulomonas sp. URHE0023 TaxID=1380354 RepID=UPI00048385D3|nr:extracellular solute-binding protein [Cellulomonas sp. URHE0023]
MRKSRTTSAVALGAIVAFGLTACSSSGGSGSSDDASSSGPTTIDVWLMKDSVTDAFLDEFVADFEADHPDIKADVQIQEWDGIGQKIVSAIASDEAPDVIEVGNTQVAQYAASGGLTDLSDKVEELGGEDWIPGLADPGKIGDAQYGIPYYAANRVVIYNKDLFTAAGITEAPADRDQWIADTTALNTGDVQGIYLPGQNWYALSGFIWDEGGDLAVQEGDEWKGTLDTPEALAGMDFYEQLQALGKGPKDSDEANPPQVDVFSAGTVAQIIATPGAAAKVVEANPALDGKLGFFPVPGKTSAEPGAVFTGGSDLVIPLSAANPDEGYEFVKALAGDEWQKKLATTMSYVPNKTTLAGVLDGDPGAAAMAKGATNGHGTPNSPNWAAVEADNPIKNYMTQVLTGADAGEAAATASEAITTALNAQS